MRITVKPVNPVFKEIFLQYVSEVEKPRYTLVGTEGPGNSTYVLECDEENPWIAVAGVQSVVRRAPLGNAMFCQVAPYGMYAWPPLFDKDKYPKP